MSERTEFRTLTKKPASEASALVATAKTVLETWSEIYLQVREKIEISGRDPRCYSFQSYLFVYKLLGEKKNNCSCVTYRNMVSYLIIWRLWTQLVHNCVTISRNMYNRPILVPTIISMACGKSFENNAFKSPKAKNTIQIVLLIVVLNESCWKQSHL